MRDSGLSKSGWNRSGRSRRSGSGATESGSSRLRSTGGPAPPTAGRTPASGSAWACPKGCLPAYLSRRKQQTLEAEEAKRRLKEQSIFVSS